MGAKTRETRKITRIERSLIKEGFERVDYGEFKTLTDTFINFRSDRLREYTLAAIPGITDRFGVLANDWFFGAEFNTKNGNFVVLFPYTMDNRELDRPLEIYKMGEFKTANLTPILNKFNEAISKENGSNLLRKGKGKAMASAGLSQSA